MRAVKVECHECGAALAPGEGLLVNVNAHAPGEGPVPISPTVTAFSGITRVRRFCRDECATSYWLRPTDTPLVDTATHPNPHAPCAVSVAEKTPGVPSHVTLAASSPTAWHLNRWWQDPDAGEAEADVVVPSAVARDVQHAPSRPPAAPKTRWWMVVGLVLAALALGLGLAWPAFGQSPPLALPAHARAVVHGDSLTAEWAYGFAWETATVRDATALDLDLRPLGSTGSTCHGIAGKVWIHVRPDAPTHVVLECGMNDGKYAAWTQANQNAYVNGLTAYANALGTQSTLLLLTPPAVEPKSWTYTPTTANGYNRTLGRFRDAALVWAAARGVAVCDVYARTLPLYVGAGERFTRDGVHPTAAGARVMGQAVADCLTPGVTVLAGDELATPLARLRRVYQTRRTLEMMAPTPNYGPAEGASLMRGRLWMDGMLDEFRRTIWEGAP